MSAPGVPGPPAPAPARARPAGPRAGPATAGPLARPAAAAAGPQSAADLTVRPVSQTPTEASDYALLSTAYGALLAGTALSARRRDPIPSAEIPALAAATFTLSKLIVHEKVETWLRQPFVEERPGGKRRPRGRRLRYAVGELLTCTRCTGAWTALALVGLRLHAPGHRAHGHDRAGELGRQRLPARRLLLDLLPREHAGAAGRSAAAPGRGRRPAGRLAR